MKHLNGISSTAIGLAGILAALGSVSVAASAQTLPSPPHATALVPPPAPPRPRGGRAIVDASRPYRVRLPTPDGRYVDVVLRDGSTVDIVPTAGLPSQGPPPQGPPPLAPPRG